MYNVLIVDDEKMIRDDLCGLLSMEENLELDLTTAASGVEAKQILEERKIDIAIMDINMPQMSGLELYDIILENWPHCKMIFLTGYADFDYVYKVSKHARYVLKAEEDEKILEALYETIEELENDLLVEQLSDFQEDQKKQAMLHARTILLEELFDGYRPLKQLSKERVEELGIDLDLQKKVYYVIFRHNVFLMDDYEEEKKSIPLYYQLVEKYFLDFMQGTFFEYNRNYMIAMLQPKKLQVESSVIRMLTGTAEIFQKALKKNLSFSSSIVVGTEPIEIKDLITEFPGIANRMAWMSDSEVVTEGLQKEAGEEETLPDGKKLELTQKVLKLEYYLEGMEEESVLLILKELQEELQNIRSMHDLFALEIYCRISSKMLGWIKRLNLGEELAFRISTMQLYNVSLHENWKEAFGYLYRVAEQVFELKNQGVEKQKEDVIQQVKTYIADHLNEDTSLHVLAEQVHFSQEYLLRTFKKQEGVTILQYINDKKLDAAKKLLGGSELSVREIAEQLGFASQGYFGRFFRAKTGMSPKAYRDGTPR